MNVKARFICTEIKHVLTQSQPNTNTAFANLTFVPVFGSYGDGEVNKSWAKYTPSGKLEMAVTNPDAIAAFELGKVYELTFEPVA